MNSSILDEKQGIRNATLVAISGNAALGIMKVVTGILFSSISLIADGFDSIMDLFIGVFAYLGTRYSQKPADEDHHFGHEKIEMLFLLLIVGIIAITGIGILLQAIERFIEGIALVFTLAGLVITVVAITGKIALSFYVYRVAVRIGSTSLKATSFNYFTDILSSTTVLIAFISSFVGLGSVDSIAAIIICLFIFYGVITMSKEAIDGLLDKAPCEEILRRIMDVSYTVKGVKEVHKLRARITGNKISGDMHLLVNKNLTVQQGHDIAEKVASVILKEIGAKITIHLEPYDCRE